LALLAFREGRDPQDQWAPQGMLGVLDLEVLME